MRRKGQNFLVDQSILQRIADYADLHPSDSILEIGSGTGNLTEVLSRRASKVYAVEVDRNLADGLKGKFDNVEVIQGDALKVELPNYNKVVSNLPYQISSKITYRILGRPFDLAVLMYQKEFAKRMIAKAGSKDYGKLSMVTGHYSKSEILEYVPRSVFRPNPRVGSAIIRLHARQDKLDVDNNIFMRLATGIFSHRRKKLRSALQAIGVSAKSLADIDGSILEKRAEEIDPEEAARLSKQIHFF